MDIFICEGHCVIRLNLCVFLCVCNTSFKGFKNLLGRWGSPTTTKYFSSNYVFQPQEQSKTQQLYRCLKWNRSWTKKRDLEIPTQQRPRCLQCIKLKELSGLVTTTQKIKMFLPRIQRDPFRIIRSSKRGHEEELSHNSILVETVPHQCPSFLPLSMVMSYRKWFYSLDKWFSIPGNLDLVFPRDRLDWIYLGLCCILFLFYYYFFNPHPSICFIDLEREKHQSVASCKCPDQDQIYNPGMCPDPGSNQQPFGVGTML